jgi:uncharacterized protein YggE
MKKLSILTLALLPLLFSISSAQASVNETSINFTTTASIKVVPDTDTLVFSVTGVGGDSLETKTIYTEAEGAVNELIKNQKVDKKYIKTNSIYSYDSVDSSNKPTYTLTKTTSIIFNSIDKASLFIDKLTEIKNVSVNSNSLSVSGSQVLDDQLLKLATAKAKKRANLYAKSLGFKRAILIKLSESSQPIYPGPIMYADKVASPGIDAGSTDSSMVITTEWRLI